MFAALWQGRGNVRVEEIDLTSFGRGIMVAENSRSAAPGAMGAENLAGWAKFFQDTFNAGDLDGLVSLYEPEAVLVTAPGQVAVGSASIREVLAGFLALKGKFELQTKSRHQVGDIALGTLEWKLEGSNLDGNPLTLSGLAATVHRRQENGSWLLVVDNGFPFEAVGLEESVAIAPTKTARQS